jgi:predicted  nucleic acid-binding Zn-ribbon protein
MPRGKAKVATKRMGRPKGSKNKTTSKTRTKSSIECTSENAPLLNLSMKMLETWERVGNVEKAFMQMQTYVQSITAGVNKAFQNIEEQITSIKTEMLRDSAAKTSVPGNLDNTLLFKTAPKNTKKSVCAESGSCLDLAAGSSEKCEDTTTEPVDDIIM